MGTLTADQTRLPEYCEHKLPTSCRLSSIPNCCACADERAHAASYSTYIDGIGFVPRGNRWQRYCWFCKEFWQNRVEISGMRSGQTRIPEIPDQSEFLERWYEFHSGYRIVKREDGSEEKIAVLGEEFREVSPGFLPRTLEELRAGRRRGEEAQQVQQQQVSLEQEESGPNLEETLDGLFNAAVNESNTEVRQSQSERPIPVNIHAQAMNPASTRNREYQARRVAALRRELNRLRNGIERVISGLRELGEDVPDQTEASNRLTDLGRTLDEISGVPSREDAERANNSVNTLTSDTNASQSDRALASMQTRIDEARAQTNEARRSRDQAASELDLAETEFRTSQQRLQQLQREQRTTESYMRVFGTREEMMAQGDNYESPIGGMFTRAYERFRAAEEVRREERTLRQVLEDESRAGGEEETQRLAELEGMPRDVWGVPQSARSESTHPGLSVQPSVEPGSETPPALAPTGEEAMLEEYYALVRQQDRETRDGSSAEGRQNVNFPQNMLDAIVAAREREITETVNNPGERSPTPESLPDLEEVEVPMAELAVTDNEGSPPTFSVDEWWHQDAEHIVRALTTDEQLRTELDMSPQDASVLLTYFIEDFVSEHDRMTIDGLLRNDTAIWRTRLPTEWLRRRAEMHRAGTIEGMFFSGGLDVPHDWAEHHNPRMQIEVLAQAFQMSSEVRRRAVGLTPPERLQMLYRLQANRRELSDVRALEQMLDDRPQGRDRPSQDDADDVLHLALSTYRRGVSPAWERREVNRRAAIQAQLRAMAREGDHSREELEARRRDTQQAFAVAASRQAMQTSVQALVDRESQALSEEDRVRLGLDDQLGAEDRGQTTPRPTNRDDATSPGMRAAFHRLQANNYLGRPPRTALYRQLTLSDYLTSGASSPSASDTDTEPDRGLDARDSGRPEPKTDEELQVQMECKICYTQLAEVACLPCGHLVMCRWCSEQHSPCLQHDRTRPRRSAGCPVCRKGIRQKVRVFRA